MAGNTNKNIIVDTAIGLLGGAIVLGIIGTVGLSLFEQKYHDRVYPSVTINNISFAGKTKEEVAEFWLEKNQPFQTATFTFTFPSHTATVSGAELGLGYDATLSATQAILVGRSGYVLADWYSKFSPVPISLSPLLGWEEEILEEKFAAVADDINTPVQDALFSFANGRVSAFRPSRSGRHVNVPAALEKFRESLTTITDSTNNAVVIPISVIVDKPTFTTEGVNSFGIKELIGSGYSEFAHSIAGRIHNITLAAARINGILIKPGDVFSFNDALGDVSALTGFQPAYVIKEGKTVLGDGGGVCQVSSTLFRAILNAGLPVLERKEHAYRVGYYEQAGYKPGLDATVFAPSVDLKFKNDTPSYVLIQTKTDAANQKLTIELYGTRDGRHAEILNHRVWGQTPPPPTVYQDDPTLRTGVVKQVDFAAWGARASFQYKVTRGNDVLQDKVFTSAYRPWAAVYLRGTAQ